MHFSAIFAKIWDPQIWDNSGDLGSEAIFQKRRKKSEKVKKSRGFWRPLFLNHHVGLKIRAIIPEIWDPKIWDPKIWDNSGDLGSEDLGSEDLGSEDLG